MPENNDGEVRILGSLRSLDGAGVIRFEDRLEAKIDDVWLALTDPVRLGGWLGEIEGELRPGGQFRARYFASGWEGTGRVEQCEPRQSLLISTESADAEARIIEVTLTAAEGRTDLAIEVRGVPLEPIAAYAAGNQIHVEDLAAYLAGRACCDSRSRWEELHPPYQQIAANIR